MKAKKLRTSRNFYICRYNMSESYVISECKTDEKLKIILLTITYSIVLANKPPSIK